MLSSTELHDSHSNTAYVQQLDLQIFYYRLSSLESCLGLGFPPQSTPRLEQEASRRLSGTPEKPLKETIDPKHHEFFFLFYHTRYRIPLWMRKEK